MGEHDRAGGPGDANSPPEERRAFLGGASNVAMMVGLAAGYGGLAAFAVRYLFPAKDAPKQWVYVAPVDEIASGHARPFVTPSGARVAIARVKEGSTADAFIALSSTCPHLGCQVHWEAPVGRFVCPCHNGQFDSNGKALAGPPAAAGQSLLRFPLRVENGLLFLEAPIEKLAAVETLDSDGGLGHDPCLAQRPRAGWTG